MASEIKPVKRSEQLSPLSREHHDGLLFAWKIRQGLKNDTAVETISRFVQWFWQSHLHHHFKQEENTLLPAMPNDAILQRMVKEHHQIEEVVHKTQQPPFSKETLSDLATLINDHIRFEERELFPHIEHAVSERVLNDIHAQLSPNELCEKWEDEFWLKK